MPLIIWSGLIRNANIHIHLGKIAQALIQQWESLIKFIYKLKEINIEFYNKSYNEFNIESFKQNDFVYIDPPYLITNASYNKSWGKQQEKALLNFLDKLNEKGINFALSNVLKHKDKENTILKEWSENYYVNNLDYSYDNCIYHKNSRGSSKEVLITNYKTKNNEMKKAS